MGFLAWLKGLWRREKAPGSRGYQSHLPRCPSCGGPAQSSSLRNRFQCTRCGRIFS